MIKKMLTVVGIALLGLTGIVVAGIIAFVCPGTQQHPNSRQVKVNVSTY